MRAHSAQHSFRRICRRLGSVTLGIAILCAATPSYAYAPDSSEIERLYLEGQQRMEDTDFHGAADSWTRLLAMMPESKDNQATRESLIISILDAHLNAYNGLVAADGSKDVTHLRNGKRTLDRYYADFKAAYGDRTGVSQAVQDQAETLEQTILKAEREQQTVQPSRDPAPDGDSGKTVVESQPKTIVISQNTGVGLLVGGSVVTFLGLGALVMIPIGVSRVEYAEEQWALATDSTTQARLRFDGQQGVQVWVAGVILAPILLASGATMIAFGAKNRKAWNRQQASLLQSARLTPNVQRNYAGLSFSARF